MSVQQAYNELARTVRGGFNDVGQAKVDNARMALEDAAFQREMNDPRRKLQDQEANVELDRRNKPFTLKEFSGGSMNAFEHVTTKSKYTGKSPLDILHERTGLSVDTKTGKFLRQDRDGNTRELTQFEVETDAPLQGELSKVIIGTYDPVKGMKGRGEELDWKLEKGEINQQTYDQAKAEIDKFKSDPLEQLKLVEKQLEINTELGLPSEVAKGEKRRATILASLNDAERSKLDAEKRQREQYEFERRESGLDKRNRDDNWTRMQIAKMGQQGQGNAVLPNGLTAESTRKRLADVSKFIAKSGAADPNILAMLGQDPSTLSPEGQKTWIENAKNLANTSQDPDLKQAATIAVSDARALMAGSAPSQGGQTQAPPPGGQPRSMAPPAGQAQAAPQIGQVYEDGAGNRITLQRDASGKLAWVPYGK